MQSQCVATGLDAQGFANRVEAQAARDAIFQQVHVGVFEFDDFVAVDADKVVVSGVVDEIRIIHFDIAPEVEFAKQTAFDKEGKRAVNGGAGDGAVAVPGHGEQLFGTVVGIRAEGGVDNGITLGGSAEAS